jgi:Fe-S-cluster containining protein
MTENATAVDYAKFKEQPASVPCNGCTACCRHDRIALDPQRGDDLRAYQWHMELGRPTLDRKANGECMYLGPRGCTIHDKLPDICRRFDCRILFLTTPKSLRRVRIQQNPSMVEVYEAGKKRLGTLPREDPSS